MLDLVIRNGLVVDGTGRPGRRADVGIDQGRIVAVGRVADTARETIDAEGHVVTPGFIDSHTHMDAQMHWDPLGSSSCWHGVTSVVMGNCGFTLAPSRPNEREFIVRNFERSEDIPGAAMMTGIPWSWETFPEYLDVIDRLPKGINYAANIGHSALRNWVMGEAAFDREATDDEIARVVRVEYSGIHMRKTVDISAGAALERLSTLPGVIVRCATTLAQGCARFRVPVSRWRQAPV